MAFTEANLRRMAGARESLGRAGETRQRGWEGLQNSLARLRQALWEPMAQKQGFAHEKEMVGVRGAEEERLQNALYSEGGVMSEHGLKLAGMPWENKKSEYEWMMGPEGEGYRKLQKEIAEIGFPLDSPEFFDTIGYFREQFFTFFSTVGGATVDPETGETKYDLSNENLRKLKQQIMAAVPGIRAQGSRFEGRAKAIEASVDAWIDGLKNGSVPIPTVDEGGDVFDEDPFGLMGGLGVDLNKDIPSGKSKTKMPSLPEGRAGIEANFSQAIEKFREFRSQIAPAEAQAIEQLMSEANTTNDMQTVIDKINKALAPERKPVYTAPDFSKRSDETDEEYRRRMLRGLEE